MTEFVSYLYPLDNFYSMFCFQYLFQIFSDYFQCCHNRIRILQEIVYFLMMRFQSFFVYNRLGIRHFSIYFQRFWACCYLIVTCCFRWIWIQDRRLEEILPIDCILWKLNLLYSYWRIMNFLKYVIIILVFYLAIHNFCIWLNSPIHIYSYTL